MFRNSENYYDSTAGQALSNICREEKQSDKERSIAVARIVSVMQHIVDFAGFEIGERIVLIDKETRKEYR